MAKDDQFDPLPVFDLEPPPVFEVSEVKTYQGDQPQGRISADPELAPVGLQPAQPAGQLASQRPTNAAPLVLVGIVVVVVLVFLGIAAAVVRQFIAGSEPTLPVTPPTFAPEIEGADFGDGTYAVGVDIEPGTYRTPVVLTEDLTWGCYWTIMDNASRDDAEYIAYGGAPTGHPVVTVEEGQYFESDGCLGWALEPAGLTSAVAPDAMDVLPEGVWVVGPDILPGTYRSSSLLLFDEDWESCYLDTYSDATWNYTSMVGGVNVPGGHPTFTVQAGEVVDNFACGTLSLVDPDALVANAAPTGTMTDGLWIVGVDVIPGTYRTTGELTFDEDYEACYAHVYLGTRFTDEQFEDIQRFEEGYAEMTLRDGTAFISTRCGTWEIQ